MIKDSTAPKQGSNTDIRTKLCGELTDKNWDEKVEMLILVSTVVMGQSSGSKGQDGEHMSLLGVDNGFTSVNGKSFLRDDIEAVAKH